METDIEDTTETRVPRSSYVARRVLLKLSGEALSGEAPSGIDAKTLHRIAQEVVDLHQNGLEVAIVVGGGNIFRGIHGEAQGLDRVTSDHMGMLATMINALALQNVTEKLGVDSRVMSPFPMTAVCEPYSCRRARSHLQKRRLVICSAGLGDPFFTTDSAAVVRASELGCDLLLKGTKVEGVYSADPFKNPTAKHYKTLSYDQVLHHKLEVMDMAAVSLARDNGLSVAVFSLITPGALHEVLKGTGQYTLIQAKQEESS